MSHARAAVFFLYIAFAFLPASVLAVDFQCQGGAQPINCAIGSEVKQLCKEHCPAQQSEEVKPDTASQSNTSSANNPNEGLECDTARFQGVAGAGGGISGGVKCWKAGIRGGVKADKCVVKGITCQSLEQKASEVMKGAKPTQGQPGTQSGEAANTSDYQKQLQDYRENYLKDETAQQRADDAWYAQTSKEFQNDIASRLNQAYLDNAVLGAQQMIQQSGSPRNLIGTLSEWANFNDMVSSGQIAPQQLFDYMGQQGLESYDLGMLNKNAPLSNIPGEQVFSGARDLIRPSGTFNNSGGANPFALPSTNAPSNPSQSAPSANGNVLGNALVSAQEAAANAWQSVKDFTSAQWEKAMAALSPSDELTPEASLPDASTVIDSVPDGIAIDPGTSGGILDGLAGENPSDGSPALMGDAQNETLGKILSDPEAAWTGQDFANARSAAQEKFEAAQQAYNDRVESSPLARLADRFGLLPDDALSEARMQFAEINRAQSLALLRDSKVVMGGQDLPEFSDPGVQSVLSALEKSHDAQAAFIDAQVDANAAYRSAEEAAARLEDYVERNNIPRDEKGAYLARNAQEQQKLRELITDANDLNTATKDAFGKYEQALNTLNEDLVDIPPQSRYLNNLNLQLQESTAAAAEARENISRIIDSSTGEGSWWDYTKAVMGGVQEAANTPEMTAWQDQLARSEAQMQASRSTLNFLASDPRAGAALELMTADPATLSPQQQVLQGLIPSAMQQVQDQTTNFGFNYLNAYQRGEIGLGRAIFNTAGEVFGEYVPSFLYDPVSSLADANATLEQVVSGDIQSPELRQFVDSKLNGSSAPAWLQGPSEYFGSLMQNAAAENNMTGAMLAGFGKFTVDSASNVSTIFGYDAVTDVQMAELFRGEASSRGALVFDTVNTALMVAPVLRPVTNFVGDLAIGSDVRNAMGGFTDFSQFASPPPVFVGEMANSSRVLGFIDDLDGPAASYANRFEKIAVNEHNVGGLRDTVGGTSAEKITNRFRELVAGSDIGSSNPAAQQEIISAMGGVSPRASSGAANARVPALTYSPSRITETVAEANALVRGSEGAVVVPDVIVASADDVARNTNAVAGAAPDPIVLPARISQTPVSGAASPFAVGDNPYMRSFQNNISANAVASPEGLGNGAGMTARSPFEAVSTSPTTDLERLVDSFAGQSDDMKRIVLIGANDAERVNALEALGRYNNATNLGKQAVVALEKGEMTLARSLESEARVLASEGDALAAQGRAIAESPIEAQERVDALFGKDMIDVGQARAAAEPTQVLPRLRGRLGQILDAIIPSRTRIANSPNFTIEEFADAIPSNAAPVSVGQAPTRVQGVGRVDPDGTVVFYRPAAPSITDLVRTPAIVEAAPAGRPGFLARTPDGQVGWRTADGLYTDLSDAALIVKSEKGSMGGVANPLEDVVAGVPVTLPPSQTAVSSPGLINKVLAPVRSAALGLSILMNPLASPVDIPFVSQIALSASPVRAAAPSRADIVSAARSYQTPQYKANKWQQMRREVLQADKTAIAYKIRDQKPITAAEFEQVRQYLPADIMRDANGLITSARESAVKANEAAFAHLDMAMSHVNDDWCAATISAIFEKSFPGVQMPYHVYADGWFDAYKATGAYRARSGNTIEGGYQPKPMDLFFIAKKTPDTRPANVRDLPGFVERDANGVLQPGKSLTNSHVGFVLSYDAKSRMVTTLEGNASGGNYVTLKRPLSSIAGFGDSASYVKAVAPESAVGLQVTVPDSPAATGQAVNQNLPENVVHDGIKGVEVGAASTYNPLKPGWQTGGMELATGGRYNASAYEAALQTSLASKYKMGHGLYPVDGFAMVEANGKKLIVKINDNGPLVPGRIIDLNEASMRYLSDGQLGNNSGVLQDARVTVLEGGEYTPGPVAENATLVARATTDPVNRFFTEAEKAVKSAGREPAMTLEDTMNRGLVQYAARRAEGGSPEQLKTIANELAGGLKPGFYSSIAAQPKGTFISEDGVFRNVPGIRIIDWTDKFPANSYRGKPLKEVKGVVYHFTENSNSSLKTAEGVFAYHKNKGLSYTAYITDQVDESGNIIVIQGQKTGETANHITNTDARIAQRDLVRENTLGFSCVGPVSNCSARQIEAAARLTAAAESEFGALRKVGHGSIQSKSTAQMDAITATISDAARAMGFEIPKQAPEGEFEAGLIQRISQNDALPPGVDRQMIAASPGNVSVAEIVKDSLGIPHSPFDAAIAPIAEDPLLGFRTASMLESPIDVKPVQTEIAQVPEGAVIKPGESGEEPMKAIPEGLIRAAVEIPRQVTLGVRELEVMVRNAFNDSPILVRSPEPAVRPQNTAVNTPPQGQGVAPNESSVPVRTANPSEIPQAPVQAINDVPPASLPISDQPIALARTPLAESDVIRPTSPTSVALRPTSRVGDEVMQVSERPIQIASKTVRVEDINGADATAIASGDMKGALTRAEEAERKAVAAKVFIEELDTSKKLADNVNRLMSAYFNQGKVLDPQSLSSAIQKSVAQVNRFEKALADAFTAGALDAAAVERVRALYAPVKSTSQLLEEQRPQLMRLVPNSHGKVSLGATFGVDGAAEGLAAIKSTPAKLSESLAERQALEAAARDGAEKTIAAADTARAEAKRIAESEQLRLVEEQRIAEARAAQIINQTPSGQVAYVEPTTPGTWTSADVAAKGPFEVAVVRVVDVPSAPIQNPIDLPGQDPGVPSGRTPTIAREEEIDPALNPPPIPRQDPVLPFPENNGALPDGEISPTLTADGGPSAAQSQTLSPYARLRNWVSEKVADYRTNRLVAGTGPTEELAPMTDSLAQRMSELNGAEVPRTERAAGLNATVDALAARRDVAIRNASEIRAAMTDPQVPVTEGPRDVALLRAAEDMDAAAARFGESADDLTRAREAFARNTPEGDAEANAFVESGLKKLEDGRAPETRSLSLVRAAEVPAADNVIGRLNEWSAEHGGASAGAGNGPGGAGNGGSGGGASGAENAAGGSGWREAMMSATKRAALWCTQGKWSAGACAIIGFSAIGTGGIITSNIENHLAPAQEREGETLGTIRPDMTKGIVFAPDTTQQTPGAEGQPAAQPAAGGAGTDTAAGPNAAAPSDTENPGSGAPRDDGVVIGGGPRAYGGYGPAGASGGSSGGGGFFGGGMNLISGLFQGIMQWFGGDEEEKSQPQQPTTPVRQEPPVGAIVGNPQVVNAGDTTTLSWSTVSTDTSSSTCAIVTADFSVFARGGQNGSLSSGALSESTRFGLVCNVKGAQDKLLNETLIRVRGDESDPPRIFSEEQIAASQASSANPVRPTAQGSGSGRQGGSNDGSSGSPTPQDVRTCDPEQAMDSFIKCLCEAEPNPRGCNVPPGGTR